MSAAEKGKLSIFCLPNFSNRRTLWPVRKPGLRAPREIEMICRPFCIAAGVSAILSISGHAWAGAEAGDRDFPSTLLIDDPGVGDELSLPIFARRSNADGTRQSIVS